MEIRDASKLWGLITGDAEEAIAEELGDARFEASVIGPGGENLIPYAAIMHRRSRANGRNGVGAVMLKALVVRKAPPIQAADPENLKKELTLDVKKMMEANDTIVDTAVNGSAGCVDGHAAEGFLPSYNWEKGIMDDWIKTAGTTITSTVLKKRETCFGYPGQGRSGIWRSGIRDLRDVWFLLRQYGFRRYLPCKPAMQYVRDRYH